MRTACNRRRTGLEFNNRELSAQIRSRLLPALRRFLCSSRLGAKLCHVQGDREGDSKGRPTGDQSGNCDYARSAVGNHVAWVGICVSIWQATRFGESAQVEPSQKTTKGTKGTRRKLAQFTLR